jgi:hypothetical protein
MVEPNPQIGRSMEERMDSLACSLARYLALIVCCWLATSCGGGGGAGHGGGGMGIPAAVLTSLSPASVPAGNPTFTLTINGSGFVAGGTVSWNGVSLGTYTLVSASQVTIRVPAADVTTSGMTSIVVGMPSASPSNALALTITGAPAQTACVLFGTYAFIFTGFDTNGAVTIAGNFGVDAGGNVSGEDDFKDLASTRPAELITGGTCTNSATPNQGTLSLMTTGGGTATYSFVTQASSPAGKGRLAISGGPNGLSGSGRFVFAPPASFFSGDYAFGMTGADLSGGRMSLAGRLTINNNAQFNTPGTISGGVGDFNDAGSVVPNGTITGTVGVPDAYGRSLATVALGAQAPLQIAIYVLSSSAGFAVAADPAAGKPVLGGLFSAQANAGLYSNGYLSAPIVLSTWGTVAGMTPSSATSVGLASGFNSAAGTFNLQLDQMIGGTASLNQSISGATYSIAANGRATMSFMSGPTTYNYVLYLDAQNDGYMVGTGATAEFGFFEAQATPALSNGTFAVGTWFPAASASPNNALQVTLSNGIISGGLTGTYTLSGTGRGTAALTAPLTGSSITSLVFYVIGAGALEMMGADGGGDTADAIAFLHS